MFILQMNFGNENWIGKYKKKITQFVLSFLTKPFTKNENDIIRFMHDHCKSI